MASFLNDPLLLDSCTKGDGEQNEKKLSSLLRPKEVDKNSMFCEFATEGMGGCRRCCSGQAHSVSLFK